MQKLKLKFQKLEQSFFQRNAVDVARELIGAELLLDGTGGIIVETEAYLLNDPASHSFKGQSRRNGSMFGPAGFSYVYRSYGIHWCLNAVCLPGSAVLIRALEPRAGVNLMLERRGVENIRLTCSGPGRLCQALGIDGSHDGEPLSERPFMFRKFTAPSLLVIGKRIGISRAMDQPWRFGLQGSNFLSHKF
jgi:DNA-3-methyladenine glycosylase